MTPEDIAQINSLISKKCLDSVAEALDTIELKSTENEPLLNWPHALHILAHLYNNNLPDARFLYMRMPDSLKDNVEVVATWHLVKVFWNKAYDKYWESLNASVWKGDCLVFIEALCEKTREKMIHLIGEAYVNISLEKVSLYIGLNHNDTISRIMREGWEIENNLITIKKKKVDDYNLENDENLQKLTEYVLQLES